MPKRPPKEWFKNCQKGVEEKGTVIDSGAVCGNIWYNKKTQKERNKITKQIEAKRHKSKK